jgi:hypothetical protein
LFHRIAFPARIVVGENVKAGKPLGTEMSRSVIFLRSVLRLIPNRAAALIWLPSVYASTVSRSGRSTRARIWR